MLRNLQTMDLKQFSSEIENIKKEILDYADVNVEEDAAITLEVIDVIQEEINKRKGKSKNTDLKSDVKLLAYLNLFSSLMNAGYEDEEDMDIFEDEEDLEDASQDSEEDDEDNE